MTVETFVLSAPGRDSRRDGLTEELEDVGFTAIQDISQDGLMFTWLRALRYAQERESDWTVLVTDDAPPFPGWDRELGYALRNSPSPILSLTHFARAGTLAAERGFAYGVDGIWGPAIALRSDIIQSVVELTYTILDIDRTYQHDDGALLIWARANREEVAYTAHALFDHCSDWRSLMGHAGRPEQRRPGLAIHPTNAPEPPWTKRGVYRHKLYIGKPTLRVMKEMGL